METEPKNTTAALLQEFREKIFIIKGIRSTLDFSNIKSSPDADLEILKLIQALDEPASEIKELVEKAKELIEKLKK